MLAPCEHFASLLSFQTVLKHVVETIKGIYCTIVQIIVYSECIVLYKHSSSYNKYKQFSISSNITTTSTCVVLSAFTEYKIQTAIYNANNSH
jgi:hypothetical protein